VPVLGDQWHCAALAPCSHRRPVDFARKILGPETEGDRLADIETSAGRITADAYVPAPGSVSPKFSRTGLSLPVCSLTHPITDATRVVESTVMDETFRIAITRLGDRVRVGGMAEISGTPIVGRTRYSNLLVNTGLGTLGWAMACGSARIIADLMSGRKPDIEVADLGHSRYRL
jgi:D-amino-acid dehydrogenase